MQTSSLPFLDAVKGELKYRLGKTAPEKNEIDSMASQWKTILDHSSAQTFPLPVSPAQRILFVTGYGLSPTMLSYETVLATALHLRGCSVSVLFCNETLPACEFNATGNNRPDAGPFRSGLSRPATLRTCTLCVSNIRELYQPLPVELHGYDAFLNPLDRQTAATIASSVAFEDFKSFEFEGVKIGEEVFASILRVTLCGTVPDTGRNRWLVTRYLHACILMATAARKAYTALKPDRIMAIHGVYATHGVATKVANHMRIPIVIYGIPYRKNTIWLAHNDSYHRTLMREPSSAWNDRPLNASEKEKTWEYLLSRQTGGKDYVTYHPNPVESADALFQSLKIDRTRQIISLFTNVIWDAQIYYNFNVFENIFGWIEATIRELSKNDRVWLVIRVHPAEVKGGVPTKQPILPEIRRMFPTLPPNVRIIPPESNLSSYTLAENSRAALIYGTKMGLEMAARGLPVVVCGETFNRGKGFTIDVESQEQYRAILKDIHAIGPLDEPRKALALKYAHYIFFRKMIDFPFINIQHVQNSVGVRFTFSDLSELNPGKNQGLDAIMNGILNLAPLHLESDSPKHPGT